MSVYNFSVKDYKGNDVSLSEYKGKVLLIVNTATRCGFTKQYKALQDLYSKYRDKGFEILDFPCNSFGGQAKEPIEEIYDIRRERFGVEFPLFDKVKVNGKDAIELYQYLKSNKPTDEGVEKIRWNFTKFLIDKNGNIAYRFDSRVKPEEIDEIIESVINS